MPLTQDTRIGQLKTPLGDTGLQLLRFSGREGVSELFEFTVDAVSDSASIDFNSIIGSNCTVSITTITGDKRYFCGTATDAQSQGAQLQNFYRYRLVLRPWLWLLSKRVNSLIFHDMTAPDIIAKVFGDYGSAKFDRQLQKSYPQLEYCVQHNETDLDFVCRLMESHGISYHFEFKDDEQKLILGDNAGAYPNITGESSRAFYPQHGQYVADFEHFSEWVPARRFTTGKVTLNDYEFKKPSSNLVVETPGNASYENGQLERYSHPGKYFVQGDGTTYGKIGIDAEATPDGHHLGSGDCLSLAAGMMVTLAEHPDSALNVEYLSVWCSHSFTAQNYESGDGSDSEYHGSYEFVRSNVPYAPPMVTPRPFIAGPQTAKVVGDGEIDCDEHGRIKVRFHWDRKSDESMRCRVAQVWAGPQWGGIYIPRVGMEVLVQFIDGDPDRPIVIGCVYNGDNKPPYPLPGKKNIAGWKSNSTEGGGGYNELVFDDTKGNELVREHAQYNKDTTVENDETRQVKHDRTSTITHDDTLTVNHDLTTTVDHDIMIEAKHMLTLKVGASTIVMDMTSITITSPTITIDAKAEFQSKAGSISQHSSSGPFVISGTPVKIN